MSNQTSAGKILIIEDEPSIRKILRVSLEANGFDVFEADTGKVGIQLAAERVPHLVLLDLGLPDRNGLSVIHALREWATMPIIILSVQDDEQSKIDALDAGADDYLSKPFSVPELLARIRVALRHAGPSSNTSTVKVGSIEMDLLSHTVKVDGTSVKLTSTEFDILRLLMKNAEKVVTHRQLLKEVWGPNSVEHTQYVRVYLAQIRKKLGEKAGEQIQTEAGIGYRLHCE